MIELEFYKAWWVNATVYETTGAMLLEHTIPLEDFRWDNPDWEIVERKDRFTILRGVYDPGCHIYVALKVVGEEPCTRHASPSGGRTGPASGASSPSVSSSVSPASASTSASSTIDEAANAVKWLVDTHSTILLNDGEKCILYTPALGTVEAKGLELAVEMQRSKIKQQREGGA